MEMLIKIGVSLYVFGLINFVVYAFCEAFDIYSGRIWEKISSNSAQETPSSYGGEECAFPPFFATYLQFWRKRVIILLKVR